MEEELARLKTLSAAMTLEAGEETCDRWQASAGLSLADRGSALRGIHIYPAALPNGRRIKLLKTLLSSACERDCYYCPFRAGRDMRRASFQPEQFARLFMQLHEGDIANGIFLSSGLIGGGMRSQDRLLDTAGILRRRLGFRGYLHLKILPGAEYSQVEQAMQLADRVSINLEAPTDRSLSQLAPHKQFTQELLQPLIWMQQIRRGPGQFKTWTGHWPSSVTQFVVGGADESDLELLAMTDRLMQMAGLQRAYFSPFHPVPGTPLEQHPATLLAREQHLYQASYLLRDYGFVLEELPFEPDGSLPTRSDPKQVWAEKNLADSPLEVNRADRQSLLRVPGIGPRAAAAILEARRLGRIRDASTLVKLGIAAQRAVPFLVFDGRRPMVQPFLFESGA
jgi:predicted DNA-binding helix-hairpin-helix protein